jgi:hypothetical protein
MAGFDLVDPSTGEAFARYRTVHEALRDVWDVLQLGGEQAVAGLRLEYEDGPGRTKVVAQGARLVSLAALAHPSRN